VSIVRTDACSTPSQSPVNDHNAKQSAADHLFR
jgi:hypothetical protein